MIENILISEENIQIIVFPQGIDIFKVLNW
jgi:hypothetical protein